MVEYELSEHAGDMQRERNISEVWVKSTMESPDKTEQHDDGMVHYIRPIDEFGGRRLRVIVNPAVKPMRVITLFFDRKLGKR